MIVNQRQLSEITGVSTVTLTEWQKAGMPMVEREQNGLANEYETVQVIRWMVQRELSKVQAESQRDRLTRLQADDMELTLAVVLLRNRGVKLSYAELEAAEPLIGYIRRVDGYGAGSGMAYRTHSMLQLKRDPYALGESAHLNNPGLVDWNKDGVIYEGWVLERDPTDDRMHQVVQMWWIRNLEGMPAKPEIKRRPRP